jgi:hypothetical protein
MAAEGVVRTDEEIRRVLEHARNGITRYGFGEDLHPADLAQPWGNARWQDNAWLRGVRDVLAWLLGDVTTGPMTGARTAQPTLTDIYDDLADMDEIMQQGSRIPVRPGWPPPQTGEAWDATLDWLQGRQDWAPACEHGGTYQCGCPQDAALTPEQRAEMWIPQS